MLIAIAFCTSNPVKAALLNWLPWDAFLKVKLFLSATRVPLPGTPRLQGTNATTSAGTAVLDCPGGSTGTSRPLRFAARQGRSASGAGPSYGLPGQSRALPAWPAVRNLDGRKLAFSGQTAAEAG